MANDSAFGAPNMAPKRKAAEAEEPASKAVKTSGVARVIVEACKS